MKKANKSKKLKKSHFERNLVLLKMFKGMFLKLFAIALIVSLNNIALFQIGHTLGYFNDTEASETNTFAASSLDFSLNSSSDFAPEVDEDNDALRDISVLNNGTLGFKYSVKTVNETGALCDGLELRASLDGGTPIVEPLSTFEIGPFDFSSLEDWDFKAKLTLDSPELEEETCSFNFEYFGWQKNSLGQLSIGFSDTETITNTVRAGDLGDDYGPIRDFVVFGESDVSDNHYTATGDNVSITRGMIGGNRSIRLGANNLVPGIRAGGDVRTDQGVNVGSKGIIVNDSIDKLGLQNIINGDVHSGTVETNSDVEFKGNVISGGLFKVATGTIARLNVDAGSANLVGDSSVSGTLTLPNGVSPTGTGTYVTLNNDGVPPPATPNTFAHISLPTPNVFSASADPGKNIELTDENTPLTLTPGVYGDISSSSARVVLNLSSGTYVFNSFKLKGTNTTLNADVSNGRILIFVVSDVTTGPNFVLNLIGGNSNKVYLESGGEVQLGGSNEWHGTIYSTKSNEPSKFGITTGNNTKVSGALYSKQQVNVGGNNELTLVGPYFGTYSGSGPSLTSGVVLNEIYPHKYNDANDNLASPFDREWIELYNNTSSAVDVSGWKISELSSGIEKFYPIVASGATSTQVQPYNGASTVIEPGGLLILEFGNLTAHLNDGGDTVRLYDPLNVFIDGHEYPNTLAGKSHQRIPNGGIWIDPEPTPGQSNRVSRQDLIDAGLDEATIDMIVKLLAEKGETLIGEEVENKAPTEKEETTETIESNGEAIMREEEAEILEALDDVGSGPTMGGAPELEEIEINPTPTTESVVEPEVITEVEAIISDPKITVTETITEPVTEPVSELISTSLQE